ncbi:TetR/AcrR family transcriptional regulator [Flavicella marina]|uniref:TetR/AcrR family transcriptional regulator n=1 Tax=Flavicella marina TaxID=1475951 RepID=UPI0012641E93|nr:TetR/AcrR family transcriptional regulator [Flavicella marina]
MNDLHIHIEIDPELYTKNPDSSELGKKIISNSIELIYDIGFELFTFKKLGKRINSPESSIYRYFENKHKLLIYLTSWYWTWMEYRIVFATTNISSAENRLNNALDLLTKPILIDNDFSYVDEVMLSEIIFSESIKAYHTKKVDEENENGSFTSYKSVVNRVSDIVLEIKPTFQYPHMLISTVIEGAHHQKYFSEHLPSLTDMTSDKNAITKFYKELVFNLLKPN